MALDNASSRRIAFLLATIALGAPIALARPVADEKTPTGATLTTAGAPAEADSLGASSDEARRFRSHVVTLSNPFFEGRAPGTRGGEVAAEYLEWWMKRLGLTPAFADASGAPNASFRQGFTVSGDVQVKEAAFAYRAGEAESALTPGEDFNVLGVSGNAKASGPLVFCGYSIMDGPGGYASYGPHDDLTGKIALILRWEPMTDEGTSRWQDLTGWTHNASLLPKLRNAEQRGAAGVILVNAPGAKDSRAGKLESAQRTRFGKPIGIPVVMLSDAAAATLVERAGSGRTLADLRKEADADGQHMAAELGKVAASIGAAIETEQIPTANVGGVLRGRGALADQYVVVGGHYDHLGYGHFGSRGGSEADGQIHPGADDNASGTAGVLLAAERLSREYASLPEGAEARSVLFLGFSAEESGLIGSRKFLESPPFAASQIFTMLNMDMIGRLRNDKLEVGGVGTAEGFAEWLAPKFEASGIAIEQSKGGQGPSDHASFYQANIPVLFFFTGLHEQYHAPTDTADTINVEGGARVAGLVSELALALARRPEPLTFKSTGTTSKQGSLKGVSVRLGIAPGNYADDQPGVSVGEVYEGTSAGLAGIKKGDRLIRWGGEELADVGAMMDRLAGHKPGDIVEIVIVRDGKEIPLQVKMLPRQTNDR